ncbi:MAG: hypothetical protein VX679_06505 [Pseudomonadota bacterium]|jgi:hypothetical protein|nr:hypothetical protein [Pseudomonadota bacterium]
MGKYMLFSNLLVVLVLGLVPPNAWSYGGGGGSQSTSCKKPSFKDMTPVKGTVVSPGARFSFTASANTNPKSIKVVVKGNEVELSVEKNGSVNVSGNLPSSIKGGYARVNISASSSPNSCVGTDGWLLKLAEQ